MRYVIPSIGRCASSMMAHQIHKAAGSPDWQYRQDWVNAPDQVIKTHAHFEHEPAFDYRAVFCTGRIGDVIASLTMMSDKLWVEEHLRHLGVSYARIALFHTLWIDPEADWGHTEAWKFLVHGDKFGFKRNLESWRQSEHVMFVHYDQWEADPVTTFSRLREFTGLPLVPAQIKPRRGKFDFLPKVLQAAIRQEYGDLA